MATILAGLLTSACSVFGIRSGTEEPAFETVATAGPVEIRRYGARMVAETDVAGDPWAARSTGFRRLAGYIFGGNEGRTSIAMTAPVTQNPAASGWTIQFILPSDLGAAPTPRDAAVRIVTAPPATVAVLRFSGVGTQSTIEARQAELMASLPPGWRATGRPAAWFYDPPWTIPPLRRNEVAVAVSPT